MEISSVPVVPLKDNAPSGQLAGLGWWISGAVLPMGSLSFYRRASQRRVGSALLFFFAFTVVITFLSTLALTNPLAGFTNDIRDAYQKGTIPAITIRNGIAEVNGPQPFVLADQYTSNGAIFIAVDTTGQITSIDRSRYNQGVLVTRTDLHVLNSDGRYQVLPLAELNTLLGRDPLMINGDTVSRAWVVFTVVFTIIFFILLVLWNSVARLMFIAMIAVVIWAIASLVRPKMGFGPFLISGLYAVVPAVYLSHLLSRVSVSFVGLQTILLMIFWLVALVASLSQEKFFRQDLPPRLWTAWIGVPLLLLMIVDVFVKIPSPYGGIVLWVVALLTGSILVGLRLYFHLRDMQKPSPESPSGTV